MIIYLTVVGLLLFVIGLTGFLLSFGPLERIICGSAALVGVILCVGASRVSKKAKPGEQSSSH
jgi:hypothetical protein